MRLAITDGGQTVQLGDYEAAAEAILYDFDPAFRRYAGLAQAIGQFCLVW